jgi:hypothetical protein
MNSLLNVLLPFVPGDLCAPKINADGAVKFGPNGFPQFVTNRTLEASPPSDEFIT